MRVYQPDDAFPHFAGLIVLAFSIIGWAIIAKVGLEFVSWTYSHNWEGQKLRDVMFAYVPIIWILLSSLCLIDAIRRGFGSATITLALCLFFGMLTDAFLLIGTMTAGI
jgi:hypothetical protein